MGFSAKIGSKPAFGVLGYKKLFPGLHGSKLLKTASNQLKTPLGGFGQLSKKIFFSRFWPFFACICRQNPGLDPAEKPQNGRFPGKNFGDVSGNGHNPPFWANLTRLSEREGQNDLNRRPKAFICRKPVQTRPKLPSNPSPVYMSRRPKIAILGLSVLGPEKILRPQICAVDTRLRL